MNIVICGAGDVGSHVAEMLNAAGSNKVTVIDPSADRLREVEETMDVAVCRGDCTAASVLVEAGARDADLLVAATDRDEVNMFTASVGKGLGARKTIARVHHSAYFEPRGFRYQRHFAIDRLICPEHATALAIARTLRNPGAMAIEGFARGAIEMQEFPVSRSAAAIGKTLRELDLPMGTRLAVVTRKDGSFVPEATTTIERGDVVMLVGNADVFPGARKLFHDDKRPRQRVVLMGGTPMAVWLARALRDRNFAIRIFETDRDRALELAEKIPWATVLNADPTDRTIFEEESLADADVFVALLDEDEANIIGGVLAKLRGVDHVISVLKHAKYLDLIYDIGVDKAFSPRRVAAAEIDAILDERPLRHLASLAAGVIDVFRVRVGRDAPVLGRPLKEVKLSPDWVVAAIQRDHRAYVPGAEDVIEHGDTVVVAGCHGQERSLRKLFAAP